MDTTSFTGNIAKLVELPNDLIMNGIKYDKQKRLQQSIRAYDLNQGNDLIVDTMGYDYHFSTGNHSLKEKSVLRNLILQDSTDENIYYVIHNKYNYATIYKIDENSKYELVIQKDVGTTERCPTEFLGQTDTHIFLSCQYKSYIFLHYCQKKDFKNGFYNISFSQGSNIVLLDLSNSYIKFLVTYNNDASRIYEYNIKGNTLTQMVNKILFQPYIPSSDYYYLYNNSQIDKDNNMVYFPYVPSDPSKNISVVGVNIIDDTFKIYQIDSEEFDMKHDYWAPQYYCEFFKRKNKKYIILGRTLYRSHAPSDKEPRKKLAKMYLFEFKNTGELIYLDEYNNENPLPFEVMLYDYELETMVFSTANILKVVKINNDLKFEEVYTYNNAIKMFGFTKEKALMIQNQDLSIEEIVIGNGSNLKIELEKDIYNYEGTTIETNFKTGITDLLGNYIDNTVEYKISGSATFSDGSKVKKIKLSKDGMTTVPIIVTDVSKVCVTGNILI